MVPGAAQTRPLCRSPFAFRSATGNEENFGTELPGSGSSSEQEGETDAPADPADPENPQVPETPEDDESDVVEEERLVQEGERYRFLLSDGAYLTEF